MRPDLLDCGSKLCTLLFRIFTKLGRLVQMRQPARQPMENLPIVLLLNGHPAHPFAAECPVGDPTGICHDQHAALAWFSSGHQHTGLIAQAVEGLLVQIVRY